MRQPAFPDFGSGTHSVQFYEEDSFLLDSLTSLIGIGFVDGKTVIGILTPDHREGLEKRLSARGFDLEVLAKSGKYCVFDAVETLAGLMANGRLDTLRVKSFAKYFLSSFQFDPQHKTPRILLFGEMVASSGPEATSRMLSDSSRYGMSSLTSTLSTCTAAIH